MKVFQNSTRLCLLRAFYLGGPLEAPCMLILFNLPCDPLIWVVWCAESRAKRHKAISTVIRAEWGSKISCGNPSPWPFFLMRLAQLLFCLSKVFSKIKQQCICPFPIGNDKFNCSNSLKINGLEMLNKNKTDMSISLLCLMDIYFLIEWA